MSDLYTYEGYDWAIIGSALLLLRTAKGLKQEEVGKSVWPHLSRLVQENRVSTLENQRYQDTDPQERPAISREKMEQMISQLPALFECETLTEMVHKAIGLAAYEARNIKVETHELKAITEGLGISLEALITFEKTGKGLSPAIINQIPQSLGYGLPHPLYKMLNHVVSAVGEKVQAERSRNRREQITTRGRSFEENAFLEKNREYQAAINHLDAITGCGTVSGYTEDQYRDAVEMLKAFFGPRKTSMFKTPGACELFMMALDHLLEHSPASELKR